MFKFLSLIATIFILYDFINKTYLFETGVTIATETNNYSILVYNGVWLLIDTLFLIAIYISIFGGSEIYVTQTTENVEKEESY